MSAGSGNTPWNRRGQRTAGVDVPPWLERLAAVLHHVDVAALTSFIPPAGVGRHAAVLCLFGEGPRGPDVLVIERSADLRAHAGQPALPGGAIDSGDADAEAAALREAAEETDLDPTGVQVFGRLPDLWVPVTGFVVTPVLGWWHAPTPVRARDRREVASVHRIPVADLADPANRVRVQHASGYVGPGFLVAGLTVWGFTAGLLCGLLDLAGWAVPWEPGRIVRIDGRALDADGDVR